MASKGCRDRDVKFVRSTDSPDNDNQDIVVMEEKTIDGAPPEQEVVFVEDKRQQSDVVQEDYRGAISKQRVRDGLTSSGSMQRVLLGDPPKEFRRLNQGHGDREVFISNCKLSMLIFLVAACRC